jgi:hypothetical protein
VRPFAILVIVLLLCAQQAGAAPRGGGGGGGGSRPSGASRPSAPAASTRPAGGGGFNLNRDVSAGQKPANVSRPSGGTTPATRPSGGNAAATRPGSANGANRPNGGNAATRPTNPNKPGGGNNINNGGNNINNGGNTINRGGNTINTGGNTVNVNRGVVVVNPVYRGGAAWGWNRGVVWAPAGYYWGGGFWGAFAIGAATAAIWGSYYNSVTRTTITSYQVQPSSPGATLLSNYQLTQVQCGPSNLVVIYGPNDSLICATPNSLVAAGTYTVDSSNLSLVSG